MPPQDNNPNSTAAGSPTNPSVAGSDSGVRVGDIITPSPQPQDNQAIPSNEEPLATAQQPTEVQEQPEFNPPSSPVNPVVNTELPQAQTPAPSDVQAMTTGTPVTVAPTQDITPQQSPVQQSPPDTSALFQADAATANAAGSIPPSPKKRTGLKAILLVVVLFVIYLGSAAAAYYLGTKSNKSEPAQLAVKANAIQLPKEAIVTAECTPGRGKQYIIPKDIPIGPIYDVKDGQVIAIEYLLSVSSLLTQADAFTDKITELTKQYTVDHFKLVPTPAQAGEADQHLHLIMFIVPKSVSESITCDGAAPTNPDSSQMTNMEQQ